MPKGEAADEAKRRLRLRYPAASYAKQFGIETPNWPRQAAQDS